MIERSHQRNRQQSQSAPSPSRLVFPGDLPIPRLPALPAGCGAGLVHGCGAASGQSQPGGGGSQRSHGDAVCPSLFTVGSRIKILLQAGQDWMSLGTCWFP